MPKPKTHAASRSINLRNLPDDFYWRIKVRAAQQRLSLQAYIVGLIGQDLSPSIAKVSSQAPGQGTHAAPIPWRDAPSAPDTPQTTSATMSKK